MLVISYVSRELADCCTKLEQAQQSLGPTDAQALVDMIADAEAVANAHELIEFYSADVDENGVVSIAFSPDRTVILRPVGRNIVRDADGGIAWGSVRRLTLCEIQGT